MDDEEWTCRIDAAGSWLCEHVHADGTPAPPTGLNAENAALDKGEWLPRRGALRCPDCGTLWRAWPDLHVAKYYVTFPPPRDASGSPPCLRRQTVRDIDAIIAQVFATFPNLEVGHWDSSRPNNDDGIWWFDRQGITKCAIAAESPSGNCPFLVETDELSSYNARTAQTVAQAVQWIVEELSRLSS